jgi:hypothetical protein
MGLDRTTLFLYVCVISTYLVFAVLGVWRLWRATVTARGFTIRSVDGTWRKVVLTRDRAERAALAAASRAPLEIVDSRGRVIGTLGWD